MPLIEKIIELAEFFNTRMQQSCKSLSNNLDAKLKNPRIFGQLGQREN
jgi:hypothetical protein